MWIISKSHRENFFFFYIFAIHSSSRYEKRCQMLQRLFSLFQGSKNQLWLDIKKLQNTKKTLYTKLSANMFIKPSAKLLRYVHIYLPYARHYKPRLIFFFTQFSLQLRLILQTIYVLKTEILHFLSLKSAAYK